MVHIPRMFTSNAKRLYKSVNHNNGSIEIV